MIWEDLQISMTAYEKSFVFYYKLRKRFLELGEKYNIKGVFFLPNESFYIDNKIYISLDCSLKKKEKAKVLTGLFLHELGHSIHTKLPKKIKVKWANPVYAKIFGVIEDERMERAMSSFKLSKYFADVKTYYFAGHKPRGIGEFLLYYIRYPKNLTKVHVEFKKALDLIFKEFPKTLNDVDIATEQILAYLGEVKIDTAPFEEIPGDILNPEVAKKLLQFELKKGAKNKDKNIFPLTKEEDFTLVTVIEDMPNSIGYKPAYEKIKEANLKDILRLRNIFNLRQKQIQKNKRGLYFGDLDTDEIVSAVLGQTNVYEDKRTYISNGFTFVLLIDLSGSMRGGNILNAKIFSILVYESLKKLRDIDLTILGHTTLDFGRSATLIQRFYSSKSVETPYSIAGMKGHCDNRDGASLQYVHEMIREQTKDDVILFMISDGLPEATLPKGQNGIEELKEAVRRAEADRIKIFHVAIDEDAYLPEVYKRSFLISDFKKLEKLFQKIVNEQF